MLGVFKIEGTPNLKLDRLEKLRKSRKYLKKTCKIEQNITGLPVIILPTIFGFLTKIRQNNEGASYKSVFYLKRLDLYVTLMTIDLV